MMQAVRFLSHAVERFCNQPLSWRNSFFNHISLGCGPRRMGTGHDMPFLLYKVLSPSTNDRQALVPQPLIELDPIREVLLLLGHPRNESASIVKG
jgi:hypothetical protein